LVNAADGTDCYGEVKKAGKFRVVKRTRGVSTTDLVGRMLLLTRSHFIKRSDDGFYTIAKKGEAPEPDIHAFADTTTKVSSFIPTTQKINQFANGREPKSGDKIVYIDGAFDLFHVGHIEILARAKERGDYLIVGVYDDQTVNQYQGKNLPIMNLHERVLGVLSCRYADEVVIGAPLEVSKEFVEAMRISVVCCGTTPHSYATLPNPYKMAKDLGILHVLESPSKLTTPEVITRILENHKMFEERNKKKEAKEISQSGRSFSK